MWILSSPTRNRTCVLCLGRQILNHCSNREVPQILLTSDLFSISKVSSCLNIQSVNVAMNPLYKHRVRDDCVQGRLAEKERGKGPWRYKCPSSTCIDSHWLWRGILSARKWQSRSYQFALWACVHMQSLQSCLTLCNPVDCCLPGSSVHGISQARILEWVAMPSSRGSSWSSGQTHISCGSCIAGGFLYCWATVEAQLALLYLFFNTWCFSGKSPPSGPCWRSECPALGTSLSMSFWG